MRPRLQNWIGAAVAALAIGTATLPAPVAPAIRSAEVMSRDRPPPPPGPKDPKKPKRLDGDLGTALRQLLG